MHRARHVYGSAVVVAHASAYVHGASANTTASLPCDAHRGSARAIRAIPVKGRVATFNNFRTTCVVAMKVALALCAWAAGAFAQDEVSGSGSGSGSGGGSGGADEELAYVSQSFAGHTYTAGECGDGVRLTTITGCKDAHKALSQDATLHWTFATSTDQAGCTASITVSGNGVRTGTVVFSPTTDGLVAAGSRARRTTEAPSAQLCSRVTPCNGCPFGSLDSSCKDSSGACLAFVMNTPQEVTSCHLEDDCVSCTAAAGDWMAGAAACVDTCYTPLARCQTIQQAYKLLAPDAYDRVGHACDFLDQVSGSKNDSCASAEYTWPLAALTNSQHEHTAVREWLSIASSAGIPKTRLYVTNAGTVAFGHPSDLDLGTVQAAQNAFKATIANATERMTHCKARTQPRGDDLHPKKILCLLGGGVSEQQLLATFPLSYTPHFVAAPYGSPGSWLDSPSRNSLSHAAVNNALRDSGPFYAILAIGEAATFAIAYLRRAPPNVFAAAFLFQPRPPTPATVGPRNVAVPTMVWSTNGYSPEAFDAATNFGYSFDANNSAAVALPSENEPDYDNVVTYMTNARRMFDARECSGSGVCRLPLANQSTCECDDNTFPGESDTCVERVPPKTHFLPAELHRLCTQNMDVTMSYDECIRAAGEAGGDFRMGAGAANEQACFFKLPNNYEYGPPTDDAIEMCTQHIAVAQQSNDGYVYDTGECADGMRVDSLLECEDAYYALAKDTSVQWTFDMLGGSEGCGATIKNDGNGGKVGVVAFGYPTIAVEGTPTGPDRGVAEWAHVCARIDDRMHLPPIEADGVLYSTNAVCAADARRVTTIEACQKAAATFNVPLHTGNVSSDNQANVCRTNRSRHNGTMLEFGEGDELGHGGLTMIVCAKNTPLTLEAGQTQTAGPAVPDVTTQPDGTTTAAPPHVTSPSHNETTAASVRTTEAQTTPPGAVVPSDDDDDDQPVLAITLGTLGGLALMFGVYSGVRAWQSGKTDDGIEDHLSLL